MNKLPMPAADDAVAFTALANNPAVTSSYPQLQALIARVHVAYRLYVVARGRPTFVLAPLSEQQADLMKGHYASPPNDLAHISQMRASVEHLVCPMCGSMHTGTLDHFLPQTRYPLFAIFSPNLVPACKCNSKRGQLLDGPNPGERVLHPYFDDCLGQRLIRAQFDDLGPVPRVSLVVTVNGTHPDIAAIRFHVNKIVEMSAIQKHLADRWSKFFRKPSLVVRDLRHNVASQQELRQILDTELDTLDDSHGGKNNWESVFVAGLLHPPTLAWLYGRFTMVGRIPDSPLF